MWRSELRSERKTCFNLLSMMVFSLWCYVYLVLLLYTTTHKFGVSKKVILLFNKDTLNWSKGSKDIYNVTKYLYTKLMLFFWIFYSSTQNPALHKKILRSTTVSNQHTRMISEGSWRLEEWCWKFSFASQEYFTILQLLLVCYFLINAVSIRYFQNI